MITQKDVWAVRHSALYAWRLGFRYFGQAMFDTRYEVLSEHRLPMYVDLFRDVIKWYKDV